MRRNVARRSYLHYGERAWENRITEKSDHSIVVKDKDIS
jgi:hypothetical protein